MVEMNGIEPSTSCLPDKRDSVDSAISANDLRADVSDGCSSGCSSTPETVQKTDLSALADALRNLTPDERAALARMLDGGDE